MAFTRTWLKSVTKDDEMVSAIMEEHVSVVDGLKQKMETLKAEADKAADLQKQLEGMQGGEDFKEKYEKEHQAFEDFKKKTASDAEAAKVKAAYRKLLSGEGISEKRLDSILKVTDFAGMKLDKDGNLEKADELKKAINDEWSEFKTTVTERGATVEKPPQAGKAKMTKEEIFAIKDTGKRQQAIAENHELFGF